MSSSDEHESNNHNNYNHNDNHPAPRVTVAADAQAVLEDADDDTLRIMLSTDNHLGFNERDPVRGRCVLRLVSCCYLL